MSMVPTSRDCSTFLLGAAVTQRAREAGADDVLKKPLSTQELAASLARVLQVSR